MNIMTSLTLKHLRKNKKRTFATIVGIALSVGMVVAVLGFFETAMYSLKESIIQSNMFESHLTCVLDNKDEVKKAISQDGVKSYGLTASARLRSSSDDAELYVEYVTQNGLDKTKPQLSEGKLPTSSSEVIISNYYSEKLKLKVGDTIDGTPMESFYSKGKDESNAKNQTLAKKVQLKIVGMWDVKKKGVFLNETSLISRLDENNFPEFLSSSTNVSLCLKNPKDVKLVFEKLNEDLGETADKNEHYDRKVHYTSFYLMTLGIFVEPAMNLFYNGSLAFVIGLILMASILLIHNAFAISVVERSKDVGMLSSIGASRSQIFFGAIKEGLFLFLFAAPLGIIFGGLGLYLFSFCFSNSPFGEYIKIKVVVSFYTLLLSCIISFFTVFISSLIPSIRTSKITIISSIRGNSFIKLKKRSVKTSKLTAKLFGFEGTLALKNLKRNRAKYRSTLLGLILSVFLFTTMSGIVKMIDADVELRKRLNGSTDVGEMIVRYSGKVEDEHLKSIAKSIKTENGVKQVAIQRSMPLNAEINEAFVSKKVIEYKEEIKKAKAKTKNNISLDYYSDVSSYLGCALKSFDDETMKNFLQSIGEKFEDYNNPSNIKVLVNKDAFLTRGKKGIGRDELIDNIFNLQNNNKIKVDFFEYVFDEKEGKEKRKKQSELEFQIGAFYKEGPLSYTPPLEPGACFIVTEKVLKKIQQETFKFYRDNEGKQGTFEDYHNYIANAEINVTLDDETKKNVATTLDLAETIKKIENGPKVMFTDLTTQSRMVNGLRLMILGCVYTFIGLIFLICFINVINTISTSITLRQREFSILRSVGLSLKSFNKMIIFESLFYGLKTILYGVPLSLACVVLVYVFLFSPHLTISFEFDYFGNAIAILSVLGFILVSMYFSSKKIKAKNIIDVLKIESI